MRQCRPALQSFLSQARFRTQHLDDLSKGEEQESGLKDRGDIALLLGLRSVALGQLVQHLLNGGLALSSHRLDLGGQLGPLPIESVREFGQNPETRIEDLSLLDFLDAS